MHHRCRSVVSSPVAAPLRLGFGSKVATLESADAAIFVLVPADCNANYGSTGKGCVACATGQTSTGGPVVATSTTPAATW